MAIRKRKPETTSTKPETRARDWPACWRAAHENLGPIDPMPEGLALPEIARDLYALREVYCVTTSTTDTECDERIDRLRKVTDPLIVLSIVAPHIKPVASTPVVEVTADHEDADGIALPVDIGNGTNGGFVDGGTTSTTGVVFAQTEADANRIAQETGGKRNGWD